MVSKSPLFIGLILILFCISSVGLCENAEFQRKVAALQEKIDETKRELANAKSDWEWGRTSHFESSIKEAELAKQKIPFLEEKIRILEHQKDLNSIHVKSNSEQEYKKIKKTLLEEKISKVKNEITDAKRNWEWNRTSHFESSRLEGENNLARIPGLERELQRLELELVLGE